MKLKRSLQLFMENHTFQLYWRRMPVLQKIFHVQVLILYLCWRQIWHRQLHIEHPIPKYYYSLWPSYFVSQQIYDQYCLVSFTFFSFKYMFVSEHLYAYNTKTAYWMILNQILYRSKGKKIPFVRHPHHWMHSILASWV